MKRNTDIKAFSAESQKSFSSVYLNGGWSFVITRIETWTRKILKRFFFKLIVLFQHSFKRMRNLKPDYYSMHIYIQYSFRMHRTLLQRFFFPRFSRLSRLSWWFFVIFLFELRVFVCNFPVVSCLCIFGWCKRRNDQSRRFRNG